MNFVNSFTEKLDFYIVLIVLCAGFFQKLYLRGFTWSANSSYDSALKTLAVSAVASAVYIGLIKDPNSANNWAKYFISYFAATSLYELLVSPFIELIKKWTNQNP